MYSDSYVCTVNREKRCVDISYHFVLIQDTFKPSRSQDLQCVNITPKNAINLIYISVRSYFVILKISQHFNLMYY